MIYGEVIGEIWSTQKLAALTGMKMLVVRPAADGVDARGLTPQRLDLVAIDLVGAGVGDRVLVVFGAAARIAVYAAEVPPIEAAIVGVVDDVHLRSTADEAEPKKPNVEAAPKPAKRPRSPRLRAAKPRRETRELTPDTADLFVDESIPAENLQVIQDPDVGSSPEIDNDIPDLPGFGDVDAIWNDDESSDADEDGKTP